MALGDRLISALGGVTKEDLEQVKSSYQLAMEAQQARVAEAYSVYDGRMASLQQSIQQWEALGSIPGLLDGEIAPPDLARVARTLYDYAPEAKNAVQHYTAIAVGDSISIKVRPKPEKGKTELGKKATGNPDGEEDNAPQDLFDEFFEAEENEVVFSIEAQQELSDDLIIDARLIYLFFPTKPVPTVRTLDKPFEITKVISNPEDKSEIWFYKREWTPEGMTKQTVYYRFWRMKDKPVIVKAVDGTFKQYQNQEAWLTQLIDPGCIISKMDNGDYVYMVMLTYGPLFKPAIDWIKQHARFMEDRATIVKNRATYMDEYTTDSGSRGITALQQKLQSTLQTPGGGLLTTIERNPVASAGSALLHNKAVEAKQRSVGTGADDAMRDGRLFRSMPAAAFSIPIALLYMDAEASGNLNAIIELMKRASALWKRYRSMWHSFYTRMVKFILNMMGYSQPVIVDIDAPPIVEDGLAEFTDAVLQGYDKGLVPKEEAMRLYLVRLGSKNVDELLRKQRELDEEEEIDKPEPSLPVTPPVPPMPMMNKNGAKPDE